MMKIIIIAPHILIPGKASEEDWHRTPAANG